MPRTRLIMLAEIAIFAALALLFDLVIPSQTPLIKISFKMVPIIILGIRWGLGAGVAGGVLWGLLQIMLGEASITHFAQGLIDYPLAFGAVGLAGIFARGIQRRLRRGQPFDWTFAALLFGAVIVSHVGRYVFHVISGVIFFGSYAPEGQSPLLYSLITNGTAFLTETATGIIVLALIFPFARVLLRNRYYPLLPAKPVG